MVCPARRASSGRMWRTSSPARSRRSASQIRCSSGSGRIDCGPGAQASLTGQLFRSSIRRSGGQAAATMSDVFTLNGLADLGQLVSAIAVVISLVYLAHQVRQNTDSLKTENYARALERVAAMQARLSSDATFAAILTRGAVDPSRLTVEERVQFT